MIGVFNLFAFNTVSNKVGFIASMEKAREFQRNTYFCFIDYAKAFDFVWITINYGKFSKTWEYQTT